MPLTMINAGEEVEIQRISGLPEMKRHLTELGFIIGDRISVVNKIDSGLIVLVKDARIAVNNEIAMHILV